MANPLPPATACPLCHDVDRTTACRFCGFFKADGRIIVEAQRLMVTGDWAMLSDEQQRLLKLWEGNV